MKLRYVHPHHRPGPRAEVEVVGGGGGRTERETTEYDITLDMESLPPTNSAASSSGHPHGKRGLN